MLLIAPEGMEVAFTHRADSGHVDMTPRDAAICELPAIDVRQIQMNRVSKITQSGFVFAELHRHVWANLVAALPDSGADGGVQILRAAQEFFAHFLDSARRDVPYRAAPTGVHRRHRAMRGIDDEDRDAVSSLHRDEHSRCVFDEGITFAQAARTAACVNDDIRMHLVQRGEVSTTTETVRPARAEAEDQPIERIERAHSVNILGVFVEHQG